MSAQWLPRFDVRGDARAALWLALVLALPVAVLALAWARGEGWW